MYNTSIIKGDTLKIYIDGTARGNPDPAASAFLIIYNDEIIHEGCYYIGTATNNTAEYQAIINVLKVKLYKFYK